MTDGLRDQIAHLRAIMPQLHAVTDEAARIVQVVESFLGDECKLNLSAHVDFDRNDFPDGTETCTRLAYGRIDGQFRLIVSDMESDRSGEDVHLTRTAWINCTRDIKLRTIEHIPALLNAVRRRIELTIKQANEATVTVKELLQDLGIAGKEEKR